MKKIIACLCAAALSVSIAACGNQTTSDHTYPNTVLTGEVQAVTDTSVTLLLGELSFHGNSLRGRDRIPGGAGNNW